MKQLYTLLKPFKHIVASVQSGDAPSLYLVSLCFIKLKETLRSFQSVRTYNPENIGCKGKDRMLDDINDEDPQQELPGTYV